MLKIRLTRTGKKKQPYYRVVVAEHTAPIGGKYVDLVGHYNPRTKELSIKKEVIEQWLNKGAQPSNTVAKLLTKEGLKHALIQIHKFPERPSKKDQKASQEQAQTGGAVAGSEKSAQEQVGVEEPKTEPVPVEKQENPSNEEKQPETA